MIAKTPAELSAMRQCGKLLAGIRAKLAKEVKVGVTPKQISAIAAAEVKKAGMQPVVLGYDGFSDVICVSVNDAIVHGLPNEVPFKEGDVVKLDLTFGYKGMVTDSAITLVAGDQKPSADVARLIKGTEESMYAGIDAIKGEGTRVGDIAAAVQKVLEKHQLGIIRDLVGHGVGHEIHEDPQIPNYGVAGTGPILHTGDTIAIEPMAALGDWRIKIAKDKNTIVMADGSLGAHFEHTVLITENGAEILTQ